MRIRIRMKHEAEDDHDDDDPRPHALRPRAQRPKFIWGHIPGFALFRWAVAEDDNVWLDVTNRRTNRTRMMSTRIRMSMRRRGGEGGGLLLVLLE